MKKLPYLFVVVGLFAAPAFAEKKSFTYKDPKGINAVSFVLDSEMEPIVGFAKDIEGDIDIDPKNPADVTGELWIPLTGFVFANGGMGDSLRSSKWMSADKFPKVSFKITKAKLKSTEGTTYSYDLTGVFSIHGVEKEVTVPATMTQVIEGMEKRGAGDFGDLLMLRSTFSLNRSDFGIKPGAITHRVAEKIDVIVALTGFELP